MRLRRPVEQLLPTNHLTKEVEDHSTLILLTVVGTNCCHSSQYSHLPSERPLLAPGKETYNNSREGSHGHWQQCNEDMPKIGPFGDQNCLTLLVCQISFVGTPEPDHGRKWPCHKATRFPKHRLEILNGPRLTQRLVYTDVCRFGTTKTTSEARNASAKGDSDGDWRYDSLKRFASDFDAAPGFYMVLLEIWL